VARTPKTAPIEHLDVVQRRTAETLMMIAYDATLGRISEREIVATLRGVVPSLVRLIESGRVTPPKGWDTEALFRPAPAKTHTKIDAKPRAPVKVVVAARGGGKTEKARAGKGR